MSRENCLKCVDKSSTSNSVVVCISISKIKNKFSRNEVSFV